MKNAVPPTTAAASSPTSTTAETTIAMTVFFVFASIANWALPVPRASAHQSARFVGGQLIIIALAQRDRRFEFGLRGGAVSGLEGDAGELEMRAAVHPFAAFEGQRSPQVRFGAGRSHEHTPELQSHPFISNAVLCM